MFSKGLEYWQKFQFLYQQSGDSTGVIRSKQNPASSSGIPITLLVIVITVIYLEMLGAVGDGFKP